MTVPSQSAPTSSAPIDRASGSIRWLASRWPTALGLAVVAATAIGMASGLDAAPVIAAALAVYVVAATFGRRWAWPSFLATVPVIGIAKVLDWQPTPVLIALGAAAGIAGIAMRRWRPWVGVPLQSVVLAVLGGIALVALAVDPVLGGVLVAVTLLAHAAGDIAYLVRDRVVPRSLAELCGVLDAVLACLVLVVTLA